LLATVIPQDSISELGKISFKETVQASFWASYAGLIRAVSTYEQCVVAGSESE
jgi:hypothetical protein